MNELMSDPGATLLFMGTANGPVPVLARPVQMDEFLDKMACAGRAGPNGL